MAAVDGITDIADRIDYNLYIKIKNFPLLLFAKMAGIDGILVWVVRMH